jgi:hypothetical protein
VRPENVKKRKRRKINPGQNFHGRFPFPAMPTWFLFLTYLILIPQHHQTTCFHNRDHFQVFGADRFTYPPGSCFTCGSKKHSDTSCSAHSNLAQECYQPPSVVNPLTVSCQTNCKKRLILDLRAVNCHLLKPAMYYIEKGHFMFSFDFSFRIPSY